jgi:hypothetical protein
MTGERKVDRKKCAERWKRKHEKLRIERNMKSNLFLQKHNILLFKYKKLRFNKRPTLEPYPCHYNLI